MMNPVLLVSSLSNRHAVMLENASCARGFARDGEVFWKGDKDERSRLVRCGEWFE